MSALIDLSTRVLVQGITGRQATWSTRDMIQYGTVIAGGVVPGREGSELFGLPIFSNVAEAVDATSANTSVVYVPAAAASDAVAEAIEAHLRLVVCPVDGVPVRDASLLKRLAQKNNVTFLGANSPGVIAPGLAKVGFMPSWCYSEGPVGVISKSGSLSYEVCARLTSVGIGQSVVIGIGGDPVRGITVADAIDLLHADERSKAILLLGEIGGEEEYSAADYARRHDAKPICAFIVGKMAPPGRKLGHAGALISGPRESYMAKRAGLSEAGVLVVEALSRIPDAVSHALEIARILGKEDDLLA